MRGARIEVCYIYTSMGSMLLPTTEPFPVPQAWAHTQPVSAPSLTSGGPSFTSRACCG